MNPSYKANSAYLLERNLTSSSTGKIYLLERDLVSDDEWQVAERRYLSEGSMASIHQTDQTDNFKDVNPSNPPPKQPGGNAEGHTY